MPTVPYYQCDLDNVDCWIEYRAVRPGVETSRYYIPLRRLPRGYTVRELHETSSRVGRVVNAFVLPRSNQGWVCARGHQSFRRLFDYWNNRVIGRTRVDASDSNEHKTIGIWDLCRPPVEGEGTWSLVDAAAVYEPPAEMSDVAPDFAAPAEAPGMVEPVNVTQEGSVVTGSGSIAEAYADNGSDTDADAEGEDDPEYEFQRFAVQTDDYAVQPYTEPDLVLNGEDEDEEVEDEEGEGEGEEEEEEEGEEEGEESAAGQRQSAADLPAPGLPAARPAYGVQGNNPQGNTPQGYSQGYAQSNAQGHAPLGYAPQTYHPLPVPPPQPYTNQGYAPQDYIHAIQTYAAQVFQGHATAQAQGYPVPNHILNDYGVPSSIFPAQQPYPAQ